jgi:hypothetical protein
VATDTTAPVSASAPARSRISGGGGSAALGPAGRLFLLDGPSLVYRAARVDRDLDR